MTRRFCRSIAALAVWSTAPLGAMPMALAQSPLAVAPLSETLRGPARADYEAGRQRLAAGDFAGARVHFSRAYDVVQDPRILANLALAEKNMGRCARATALFEQALATGGVAFTAGQTRDIREMVEQCADRVSRAHLAVAPDGSSIAIDDVPVGQAPETADVWIDEGAHRVRVTKPGFRDQIALVTASSGQPLVVHVVLEPFAASAAGPAAEGSLVVRAATDDAIALDGHIVGNGAWTSRVTAGVHTLRVSAPGRTPYEADVRVAAGQKRTFDIALGADQSAPVWLWCTGGAVIVASVVVAAAVVFRSPGPVSRPDAVAPAAH